MRQDLDSDGHESVLDEVLADYMRRIDRGEPVDQQALIAAHPQLASELREYFSHAMRLERIAIGATDKVAQQVTHRGALEVRCPSCHAPMDVAVDTALTDLTCTACGSHFSLVDQNKSTWTGPPLTKLGRFELMGRIGVGGFGSVWKARDNELDRTVAIKIPRAGGMPAEEQEKFFREARAAAQLRHPNIVSVHEVGRDGDSIYIVCDFVRGVTLGDWLTGQKLTSREAAELCAKIADALHHAHEQGVVHRDLKPANIMIDGDGEPHLMDFGLARREAGEVTVTLDGQVLGTPAYMSPEQAQGEAHTADGRSDIYSLGVILFQLLTGELPFRGNARMLMHQVIHDEPPSPRKLNSNISKDLETITLKCLEKDRSRRYQTVATVADELRRYLAGEPIQARPVGQLARGFFWCKRRPMAAALMGLLTVIAVAGPLVAVNQTTLRRRAESATAEAEANLKFARGTTYNLTLSDASRIVDDEPAQALTLLENEKLCPVELRDLAWLFLEQQVRQHDRRIDAHTLAVRDLAVSRDGRSFVTASDDGSAKVWDAATGNLVHTLTDHPAGETRTIVGGADFSSDGKRIVTACPRAVCVWDAATGRKLATLAFDDYKLPEARVAASPIDDRFVSVGGNIMYVWSLKSISSHEPIRPIDLGTRQIVAAVWSADGRTLATADKHSNAVTLWDTDTWTARKSLEGHETWVWDVAFSPDGAFVASASWDGTARIWKVESGETLHTLSGHAGFVYAIAFSPTGKLLATGDHAGVIHIWDVETGEAKAHLSGHQDRISRLHFVEAGDSILSASADGTVRLWRLDQFTSGYFSLKFSPSAAPLLSSDGVAETVRSWDLTGRVRGVADHIHPDSPPSTIALLPNGEQLAAGCQDGTILVYDLHKRRVVNRFVGATSPPRRIAFSADSRVGASNDGDELLHIWDVEAGTRRATTTVTDGLFDVALSPDGELVAVGGNLFLTWADARTGRIVAQPRGHNNQIFSVAFSPDGRLLVTGSRDTTIGIWNVESRKRIDLMTGHTGAVTRVAFSADGSKLISAGDDRTVRVWDMASRACVQVLHGSTDLAQQTCLTRDGRTVVSRDWKGAIMFWDPTLGLPRGRYLLPTGRADVSSPPRGESIQEVAVCESEGSWLAALVGGDVLLWHLRGDENDTPDTDR